MQGPFHVPLGGTETLHQYPPGQGEECVDPLVWTQCAEVTASLQSRSVVTDWPPATVLSLEYVEDMSCYTSPVTFQNLKSGHHPLAETCGHLPITRHSTQAPSLPEHCPKASGARPPGPTACFPGTGQVRAPALWAFCRGRSPPGLYLHPVSAGLCPPPLAWACHTVGRGPI